MTRINTNVSSLVAQNRLQASNNDLNSALTRLSTGLRINSGADDPAGLIASEALRSEITSLNKSISNTQRASQIVTTADSALGQVNNLLNDIRGLVVEAANSGALSDDEIAANQLQLDSSLEAINRIAQSTTFQGRKLLDGSLDYNSNIGTVDSVTDSTINRAKLGSSSSLDVEVVVGTAATQATLNAGANAFTTAAQATTGAIDLDGAGAGDQTLTFTAEDTGSEFNDVSVVFEDTGAESATYDAEQKVITVTYNGGTSTAATLQATLDADLDSGGAGGGFAVTTGGTAAVIPADGIDAGTVTTGKSGGEVLNDDVVFQLNGADGAETFNFGSGTSADEIAAAVNLVTDSTGVSASVSSATVLTFTSTAYGSDSLVEVDVISEGGSGTFAANLNDISDAGSDIVATVNGVEATGDANTLSVNTSTLALSLTVSEGSSSNFSFNVSGGGATFQLGPDVNTSQQASIGIGSVSTGQLGGSAGRLYELGSGQGKSLANDVTGAADIVNQVINKVTALRGRLGAFQATTLDSNLVSLNETAANLQEAESSIRDADFAKESARLTRAQILVQSGTNVLALANQNPQNVLALLR